MHKTKNPLAIHIFTTNPQNKIQDFARKLSRSINNIVSSKGLILLVQNWGTAAAAKTKEAH